MGEISLLFNIKRTADVEALSIVRMHMLSRVDYKSAKSQYPADAQVLTNGIKKFLVAHKRYTERDLEEMRKQALDERDLARSERM